jgi:hypothetical protein
MNLIVSMHILKLFVSHCKYANENIMCMRTNNCLAIEVEIAGRRVLDMASVVSP